MTPPVLQEPFARPPRRSDPSCRWDWSGPAEADDGGRGVLDLSATNVEGATIDLRGVHRLTVDKCRLTRVVFEGAEPDLEVNIAGSIVSQSDLSGLRLVDVHQTRFSAVKLVGNDLSDSSFQDCEFADSAIRMANLRMAHLRRVQFIDCGIEDPDPYGATFEDLSFPGSHLRNFNVDSVKAARIDLRGCATLELLGVSRLNGFLIADTQLPGLAYTLGRALGLQIDG